MVEKGFEIRNEVMWYKDRLVLSQSSTLIPILLEEIHGSVVGGHSGEERTMQRVTKELFRVVIRKDIREIHSKLHHLLTK